VDPLVELARVMGQADPFAPAKARGTESGRYAPQERAAPVLPRDHAPSGDEAASGRHDRDYARRDPYADLPHIEPQSSYSDQDHSAPRYAAARSDFSAPSGHDEYPVAPRQGLADGGAYAQDDRYQDPLAMPRHKAHGQHGEYADDEPEGEYDGEYDYDSEHEDADSDDSRSGGKRRNSAKVVIAVLGLAVFGSAAAFGYRTVFKAAPAGPPPVIRADGSPTKVMPVGADTSPKAISERVGDSASERLVRRDEDPVDVGATYRPGAAGVVGSAGGPFPGATASLPPASVPATSGPASAGDPRPVRTVTIRPDQGTPPPPERAVQPSARTAPPALSPPAPRQTAALPPPSAVGASSGYAPEAAPPRVAAAPPPPRAGETGGFVVQLSAQKTEAEAQVSFRTLQAKYAVLSGRQPLIRRKDLGEKGIMYAAQVGPFGAKGEADQLCETLKSAGGSCFVQRN
jgi:hypothetical protein